MFKLNSLAALVAATSSILLLSVSQAHALYIDFADYRGAESGNAAELTFEGLSISITAAPSDYDLRITEAGLGVRCTDGFFSCLGNQGDQIDAEWGESISISFLDGPVVVNSVDFDEIFLGETAVVQADASPSVEVRGTAWRARDASASADLAGVVTSRLTISTSGLFSDTSVRGIDFDVLGDVGTVTPVDPQRPTSPIPEPASALLFAAGLATAGLARKR